MRTLALVFLLGAATSAHAAPRAKKPAPTRPAPKNPVQKEADRHFKSGVALFKEAKYTEALAEFERAYEIAPHPLVLYNIAGCHRELSRYREAVTYYRRFLADAKGKVPAARLTAAQGELDSILARVARVTLTVTPALDRTRVTIDGVVLDTAAGMPLILPPGEHWFVARADGWRNGERTVRLASGDDINVEIALGALPPERVAGSGIVDRSGGVDLSQLGENSRLLDPSLLLSVLPGDTSEDPLWLRRRHRRPRFVISGGFGTNLDRVREADSGAPSVGVGVALGARLELDVDLVIYAWAVVPSLRVRLAGDRLAAYLIAAVPVSFTDEPMSETFAAAAGGLGLRYRATRRLAISLDAYAAFAGAAHGWTFPTFLRGELWF